MSASLPPLSAETVEHQSSIAAHFGAVLSGNPIMITSPESIHDKWFFSNLLYNVIHIFQPLLPGLVQCYLDCKFPLMNICASLIVFLPYHMERQCKYYHNQSKHETLRLYLSTPGLHMHTIETRILYFTTTRWLLLDLGIFPFSNQFASFPLFMSLFYFFKLFIL